MNRFRYAMLPAALVLALGVAGCQSTAEETDAAAIDTTSQDAAREAERAAQEAREAAARAEAAARESRDSSERVERKLDELMVK